MTKNNLGKRLTAINIELEIPLSHDISLFLNTSYQRRPNALPLHIPWKIKDDPRAAV